MLLPTPLRAVWRQIIQGLTAWSGLRFCPCFVFPLLIAIHQSREGANIRPRRHSIRTINNTGPKTQNCYWLYQGCVTPSIISWVCVRVLESWSRLWYVQSYLSYIYWTSYLLNATHITICYSYTSKYIGIVQQSTFVQVKLSIFSSSSWCREDDSLWLKGYTVVNVCQTDCQELRL